MPRNASGNYTLPAGNPVVTGTTIATSWANPTLSDIAAELQNSLDRSGRGGMLAPLRGVDGSLGVPSWSFTNDPDTGMYRPASNELAFVTGGVERFRLGGTELKFGTDLKIEGADPALSFSENDTVDQNFRFRLDAGVLYLEEYTDADVLIRVHSLWTFGAGAQINASLALNGAAPYLALTESDVVDKNFRFVLNGGDLTLDEYNDAGTFIRTHSKFSFGAGVTVNDSVTVADTLPYVYLKETDGTKNLRITLDGGVLYFDRFDGSDVFVATLATWDLAVGMTLTDNVTIANSAPSLTLKDTSETDKNFKVRADAGVLKLDHVANNGTVLATKFTQSTGGGAVMSNAVGGDKGDGTINAKGLYVNGVDIGSASSAPDNVSASANGFQVFPGGVTIQWGTLPEMAVGATATFTFPVAFDEVFSVSIGYQGTAAGDPGSHVYMYEPPTPTQVKLKCETIENTGQPLTPHIVAVGYKNTGLAPTSPSTSLIIGMGTSGLAAWEWSGAGWGAQRALPTSPPTTYGVAVSKNKNVVACSGLTPGLRAWAWSASGFGTKYTDPTGVPSDARDVAIHPDTNAIAITDTTSPYVHAWAFDVVTGFGAQFSNPAAPLPNYGQCCEFSPSGGHFVIGHVSTPYVSVYEWSTAGFGTKLPNPATLPGNDVTSMCFSRDGRFLLLGMNGGAYVRAYNWSDITGIGTAFADPSTGVGNAVLGIHINPQGSAVLMGLNTSPYVAAYAFSSSGWGARYSNPATLPNGTGRSAQFSEDGAAAAVASEGTNKCLVYPFDPSTGFGTKFADPGTPVLDSSFAGSALVFA